MISTNEILKKVRKIEIKSKGLSNHMFSGAYHTTFKGRGMSFSEVREYVPGDDVRNIDWNVTARLRTPYVKVFQEERELTMMLLVDVSSSSLFGSFYQRKLEVMAEIAAVLAFSAQSNSDKVGVLFFSDKVEKFIPAKKGKSHILRIIREIITYKPTTHQYTNIDACLKYFNTATKRKSIAFLLSDFVSNAYENSLKITAYKHDLIGIQVYDSLERDLPKVGLINAMDSENGQTYWIDTNNPNERRKMQYAFEMNQKNTKELFQKNNASFVSVAVQDDYVKALRTFFNSRGIRH